MSRRELASWLMLATGVAHVAHFVLLGMDGAAAGLGVFGVIYAGIGLALRRPGKLGLWLGATLPALGGAGGLSQLASGLSIAMLVYVAVDVVVVALCIAVLVQGEEPAASS